MKNIVITFSLLLTVSIGFAMSTKSLKGARAIQQLNEYPYLEFIELKQFPFGTHKDKFDLSSLAKHSDGTVYTISDREKHHFIYKLDWKKEKLEPEIDLGVDDTLDIEAIDICGDDFYLSNEKGNKIYLVRKNEKTKKIDIDFKTSDFTVSFFDGNRGFEGLAVDCKNQLMYLTKERQPRFIITVDLKTKKIIKKWDIPEIDAFDYSDAKYENGFLYVLERTGMLVTKINAKTGEVIAKFSYQNLEKSYGYLFGPAVYPFAEALMLTPDQIWIGFDNNGLKATNDASKDLGIKNRDPLVMKFKRPEGF